MLANLRSFPRSTYRSAAIVALAGLAASGRAQICPPWEVVDTPDPVGAETAIFRDIVAISPTEVWAVGDYWDGSRIIQFSMRWDGARWTFHEIPLRATWGHGHLWAVDARAGELWAAGDQQHQDPMGFWGTHPLIVRHNGSAWEQVEVPPLGSGGSGDFIWGMTILAPDNIWFVGEGFPIPAEPQPSLALRWNGSSFEHIPTPSINTFSGPGSFGKGNSLHAISALTPDDIWAVGAAGDGDPIRTDSQILHWDGSEWKHRPGPVVGIEHSLEAVVAIAPDDVWAGGEYFDGSEYHGLAMHWDGSRWTQVPIPGGVLDFHAFASDDILAVGGGIMRWDGARWSMIETFPSVRGPALGGVSAPPGAGCEVWAAGRDLIGDNLSTLVVHRPEQAGCRADLDGDGELTFFDFLAFQNLFASGDLRADFDGSGELDFFDFLTFQNEFAAGCA